MPSKRRRKSAKIHSKVFDEVTKMIKQGKSTNVIAEELSGRGVKDKEIKEKELTIVKAEEKKLLTTVNNETPEEKVKREEERLKAEEERVKAEQLKKR